MTGNQIKNDAKESDRSDRTNRAMDQTNLTNRVDKKKELEEKLKEIQEKELEEKAIELAKKEGLAYLNLKGVPIQKEVLTLVEKEEAELAELVPIEKIGKALKVGVINPENPETKNLIKKLKERGFDLKIYIISQKSLSWALGFYKKEIKFEKVKLGIIKLEEEKMGKLEKEIKGLSELRERIAKISTTEILEVIFAGALKTRSSDIHFEPEANDLRLRFRIDGVLQDIFRLKKSDYPPILNRIKLIAGLKLNIHDAPQDGRFTLKRGGAKKEQQVSASQDQDIEIRVSVLPGAYGESIVMRLLDPQNIRANLEDLGMRDDLLAEVKKQLKKTTKAILTTGPTGSGKTTTLYAFLRFVNTPGVKIITIEDPIEYHLEGINQTQVEPEKGYNFANGLRSIVRQDPDVILVGEIRDLETAEIAMHAALTGHLVFSTLHTNNAAGTIPRLIDMGVKTQIIAPALNMAMAQRLVRKLCGICKRKVKAIPQEIEKIKIILEDIPENIKIKIPKIKDGLEIFKPVGCEECNFIGYRDRIGIFEAFVIDSELERLILKSPTVEEVENLAMKKGMVTMRQDGFIKVLEGVTDIEEVERVLGEE